MRDVRHVPISELRPPNGAASVTSLSDTVVVMACRRAALEGLEGPDRL